MRILFLDLDGVLVNDYSMTLGIVTFDSGFYIPFRTGFHQFDPKCVAALNKITDATRAKIVVSSSWRAFCGTDKEFDILKKHIRSEGVKADIIDMTPVYHLIPGVRRGDEIQEWLDETREDVDSFVILDDIDDMGELSKFLVLTEEKPGLRDSDTEKAINILDG